MKKNPFREGREVKSIDTATTSTPRSVRDIIIPRSKSPAACRRVTLTSISVEDGTLEKRLRNGELYIGSFSNGNPHGLGKYLWKDGCMYEVEWKKGKTSGKEKFSWPSGATFEGEFKSGRMEGTGTFIGSDGDTYKGSCSADQKHVYGVKQYVNGDYYEGHWRKNLQDGQGRYVWRNGNGYIGEWKYGNIHGKGVWVWDNGNRYGVNWDNGVITWPDGSGYIGCWPLDSGKKGCSDQFLNGNLPPSLDGKKRCEEGLKGYFGLELAMPLTVVGDEAVNAVVSGSGGKMFESGVVKMGVPRICIWGSDGEAGDITCEILDNIQASKLNCGGFEMEQNGINRFLKYSCVLKGEAKNPRQKIAKGHKNYDLMLNLQLGIRHCAGKHASVLSDHKTSDFDPMEKFWTRFPTEGSKTTLPHQSVEFQWKDYGPAVFRQINRAYEFLEAERIMDYSLLVGIHFHDDNTGDRIGLSPCLLRTGENYSYQNGKSMRSYHFLEAELQGMDQILAGWKPSIRLGANMPARAERVA